MAIESPKEILATGGETLKNVSFNDCSIEDYLEGTRATFEDRLANEKIPESSMDNFTVHKTLGIGAFGYIKLVSHKADNSNLFAMKIMKKQRLTRRNHVKYALAERQMTFHIRHPFITHMEYYVNDSCHLCFITPYAVGGNLLGLMKQKGVLNELYAKFYAGQIVLALEHLHSLNIIYRDLKPENVLINEDGYVQLSDFGLSKRIKNGRTATMCGTPHYFAPEIILSEFYGRSVDWWTLGVVTYELTSGSLPFYDSNEPRLYNKIINGNYKIPDNFSPNLSDFIENLLQIDTTKRYGNLKRGIDDIKNHRWFNTVDWTMLLYKQMKAPYIPPNDVRLLDLERSKRNPSIKTVAYNSKTTETVCDGFDRTDFADF